MIFTAGHWESEKERNLYSKFFAGYFFNHFAPGLEARVERLCALLESKAQEAGMDRGPRPIALNPGSTHVSFDNHIWREAPVDRGEFADVAVYDDAWLISFEVKYRSDFSCDKDIVANLRRLEKIKRNGSRLAGRQIVPCLLLLESKKNGAMRHQRNRNSQWAIYWNNHRARILLVTWEELTALADDASVRAYMQRMLNREERGA